MKICFNLFPPANKLIVFFVCAILLLAYSRSKADNKFNTPDKMEVGHMDIPNQVSHEGEAWCHTAGKKQ